jgi:hypothetical protein
MSRLQKAIQRNQGGEGRQLGFSPVAQEKPRAMLLGATVRKAEDVKTALDAGVDFLLVQAGKATEAAGIVKAASGGKAPIGAWVSELDVEGAEKLAEAGCDFVACTLEGTAAAAVDSDRMGHVLAVTGDIDDTRLRTLGPLSLEGLFVKRPAGSMTLVQQTDLIRLASLAGAPLLVSSDAGATIADLRVLRDCGAAAVVAVEGTSAAKLKALGELLRTVPPKAKAQTGRDMPLVPSMGASHEHEEDDEFPEIDE